MSSNGSTAVSIVSTEETASYYSMQSISPENCAYNSSTYPTDGIDQDLSLMYPSGYYDNNCYFYVNRKLIFCVFYPFNYFQVHIDCLMFFFFFTFIAKLSSKMVLNNIMVKQS